MTEVKYTSDIMQYLKDSYRKRFDADLPRNKSDEATALRVAEGTGVAKMVAMWEDFLQNDGFAKNLGRFLKPEIFANYQQRYAKNHNVPKERKGPRRVFTKYVCETPGCPYTTAPAFQDGDDGSDWPVNSKSDDWNLVSPNDDIPRGDCYMCGGTMWREDKLMEHKLSQYEGVL